MMKYKKMHDDVLEEYERAKNRNYKRVERYENADGNSNVMQLTFNEYKAWLDRASEMKKLYLQRKATKEEFRKVIGELDG